MFTQKALNMLHFILAIGLLLSSCDSQSDNNKNTPLITINTRQVEDPHIEGQAFVKTLEGVDHLAGMEVHIHPTSVMKNIETMKDASTAAKAMIPQVRARLQDVQRKIKDYHEKKDHYHHQKQKATQWRQILGTLKHKTKDFTENHYEKYIYYHPFYKKQVTVSWSKETISWDKWHENVQRELLTLIRKTEIRVAQANEQEQTSYEAVSGIPINEFLNQETQIIQELKKHQKNQLKVFQIVDVIMNTKKPLKKMYADDQGRFDCNIAPGTYLVLATWTSGITHLTWIEPVEVKVDEEGDVILSSTNVHSME